jgi:5-formyltetrahydrofolate cyclo-ligase
MVPAEETRTGPGHAESPELLAAKATIRASARAARAAIPAADRDPAAQAVGGAIAALPELAAAHLVLGYCARGDELDVLPSLERLRARGVRIAYPRVTGSGTLDLHEVADECDLEPGSFSLREPHPLAPRVTPQEVDAVLVPGVAFDLRGHRMGYGGGFYDRLLPQLRSGCPRIGIAFDEQLIEEVPADVHDVAVDVVVTPSRVLASTARRD